MDRREIKETPIWALYQKGRDYHRRIGTFVDTDRNYRFYEGDQWNGAKLGDVEPVTINFIKPIVKYKCAVIHDNLYIPVYSAQNHESRLFQRESERWCKLLNSYARKIWESEKMDFKGRRVTKDAAINDEGIIYVRFDEKTKMPVNEIVKKNDIYYGNENDDEIQRQPYILIRKRLSQTEAIDLARSFSLPKSKEELIVGDNETFEESGDAAKQEVDENVTVVYKMWKDGETVHFSVATRFCTIAEDKDLGISRYPIAHFNWEEKEGSSRGEGEVRWLIPNQIEVNRIAVRRDITVKYTAHPTKIVDVSKVQNPNALTTVGGIVKTNGMPVDDVSKIIGIIPPAQMSADVKLLQDDLVNISRELAGAGEAATGTIDPEQASGRAILAVQQTSRAPMTEQKESFKNFVEDLSLIWLDYLISYSDGGIPMEEEVTDPMSGRKVTQVVMVPQTALRALQATVKVDVTPKSPLDRYAQEQTIENLFVQGLLTPQRVGELETYANMLDDDSVAPKQKILDAVEKIKEAQMQIAQIDAQAKLRQQRANAFLMADPESQANAILEAQAAAQMQNQQMPLQ